MTWWGWLLLCLFAWVVLDCLICVANYRFWNFVDPRREWRG